jgi:hypothetical protein
MMIIASKIKAVIRHGWRWLCSVGEEFIPLFLQDTPSLPARLPGHTLAQQTID